MNIKEILEDNGYSVLDLGNYYKTSANWRGGDSLSSVTIYKDGICIDHVSGEKFDYKTLICKVVGLEDKAKLDKYLEQAGAILELKSKEIEEPIIKSLKTLSKDFLEKLDKSDKAQEYWINRGISIDVLRELGGGIYKNKYYFGIFNSKKELIGWQYRNLDKNCEKRYSIRGEKKNFVYPAFVCSNDIVKSRTVFLHEGLPDCMSLMTIGVRNNLVLFGTEISFSIINYLLKISDIKIIICQNNDDAGRDSSIKIRKKLLKYFDWSQVFIKELSGKNKDLNDVLVCDGAEALQNWIK
jgi:hypothetical protein